MYNHVGLQGRLTADPVLRRTQGGTMVTTFTIASDTGRRNASDQKITYFIECVAWRQAAEFVCKYLKKGRLVMVEGELTSRIYEDKNGQNRKAVEIAVQSVHFCDSKPAGQGNDQQNYDGEYTAPEGYTQVDDDEQLPF